MAMLMSCRDGQYRCADIGSLYMKGGELQFAAEAKSCCLLWAADLRANGVAFSAVFLMSFNTVTKPDTFRKTASA